MSTQADAAVAVAGAGMAGLVAAVTLAGLGVDTVLLEAADEPGGTTALSSGWVWRYCDMATFARHAPGGDRGVQEAIWHDLPDAIVWLDRCGARIVASGTENPLTDGVRIDPPQVVDALVRRLPEGVLQCERRVASARREPDGTITLEIAPGLGEARPGAVAELRVQRVVFCGGGYGADLERIARESGVADAGVHRHWAVRNSGQSDGSSMDAALQLGAQRVPVNGESYARAMPVGVNLWPDDFVRFSQVYGEHAVLVDAGGRLLRREPHDWSDAQLMWRLARSAGHGWYLLDRAALGKRTPYGTVARSVLEAQHAGAVVLEFDAGGAADALAACDVVLGAEARTAAAASVCAVAVRPGITHTLCGLRTDEDGRVLAQGRLRRRAQADVLAAGVEAGGAGRGGYASGLAQALVQGRRAATAAAAGLPTRG